MTLSRYNLIERLLIFFFALFVLGSTFSIAFAQISLGLSIIVFLFCLIFRHMNPFSGELKNFFLLIALYIVWEATASLLGKRPLGSMTLMKDEWLFLIIPIGIVVFNIYNERINIMKMLVAAVVLIGIYSIIQHFTGEHWFKDQQLVGNPEIGYRPEGNFPNTMTFGNYYAVMALFLAGYLYGMRRTLSKVWVWLTLAGSILSLIAIFLSLGRGVILAAIAGLLFFGFMMGRRLFTVVVVTVVILAAAGYALSPGLQKRVVDETARDLKGEYPGSRFYIWNNSLKIIAANPVIGVGMGNFRHEYAPLLPEGTDARRIQSHAHNDWLQAAVVGGIPGLAIYIALWVVTIMLLIRIYRNRSLSTEARAMALAALCGSVVFFSASMTEATFSDEEVRHILMLIWAAGLWPLYNRGRAPQATAIKEA